MRVATPANATTTCGGTLSAVPGNTSISLNGGTVPGRGDSGQGEAGSCYIQVNVVGSAGTYNNVATVVGTVSYLNGAPPKELSVSSNTAKLVYTSALSGTKSFNPLSVSSGGTSTVMVRLSNSSTAPLNTVSVTDPLPTGMVLASMPKAYSTCSGSPSFTAVAGASTITMTGATIAANSSCDMVFDVTATGSSNWVNTIPVGSITAEGGTVKNVNAVSGTLQYAAPTSLVVVKTTSPNTLTFPGEVSRLTITVTNGSQAVSNMSLRDYFTVDGSVSGASNGMKVAPAPSVSTTCPGGIVSAAPGGTSVLVSGVVLAANASCQVAVNVTSEVAGSITNYIPSSSITSDQGLSNSNTATTSLATQNNLGVTKQFTPNVVKPGSRSRLRLTFYNPTGLAISSLQVTDTMPAGVTIPSGPNPTTTCTGATVTSPAVNQVHVEGASLPATVNATCYAEIDVYVAAQNDYTNVIPAGDVSALSGSSVVKNSQPTSDVLRARQPIVVHKAITSLTLDSGNPSGFTTGSASTTPGTAATLTIRLTNPNAAASNTDGALNAVAFTDTLPSKLVIAQTPNASTTCSGGLLLASASGTTIRLSGAMIPAGASCDVKVDVLSNTPGSYTNTIAAGALYSYEGVTNEDATSAKLVVSSPPAVAKQFSPAVMASGGKSTLTIYLNNSNTTAATLTSDLVDTLPSTPGAMTVKSPNGLSTTCPGAVSAPAGGTTITYPTGALVPAGGCSIRVDVTATTAGDYTNYIPVGALKTTHGFNQTQASATVSVSTQGFISGRVFQDNSVTPDGVYQAGTDAPLSGISMQLRSGNTCAGALLATGTTDSQGTYLFSGLAIGTYSVCQTAQPSGTVNGITTAGTIQTVNGSTGTAGAASNPTNPTSTTSQIVGIVLNGGGSGGEISGSIDNNFAEVVQSTLSGQVFLDQNNNGVLNAADSGISGVAIQLLNGSGTVVASTTTDSSGNYSFANLNPGTYSIVEPAQPANTSNGLTVAGSMANGGTAGTPTGLATLPSKIAGIILPPNTTSSANNFAEITNNRTLSGQVFLDYNNNGSFNSGTDHGLGGQVITLTGTDINGNPVSLTTTTASDGTYTFSNVPEGTNYTLTQGSQPAGTSNGTTTAGTAGGTGGNPTSITSRITGINLSGSTTGSANNNFAELPGAVPDLAINKTHTPSSFGDGSSTGAFTISPSNMGSVATSGSISVVDTLPAGLTPTSASGTGWACAIAGQVVTCTSSNVIAATGSGTPITIKVKVGSGLVGNTLVNTAVISGGGEPSGFESNNTATDSVTIVASASVSGHVWRDTNHNRALDSGETVLAAWGVELLYNGSVIGSTTSDASGAYSFTNLSPGAGYQIRFREPKTGTIFGYPVPNEAGSSYTNGVVSTTNPTGANTSTGVLDSMTLSAGSNVVQQSLPVDPSGVVYDAVTRKPVSGAVVTISGPSGFNESMVVGGSATQTTSTDGIYQFLLTSAAPAGVYTLSITSYPSGYQASTLIPVCSNVLSVGSTPSPALVQNSNEAPATSAATHNAATCPSASSGLAGTAGSTQFYFSFVLTPGVSASVINNHIPLDPLSGGSIVVTKTTPKLNVTRGEMVPYTITATNTLSTAAPNITVRDLMPPGFKYRMGSATLNGSHLEPTVAGRTLSWANQTFAGSEKKTYRLILTVGTGVSEGKYVNTAWALNGLTGNSVSNTATATVQVVPDPTFDCSDIIGKVFDDRNANGYQDEGEPGIPNVRIATVRGLLVTSDADGRFHVACADIPQMDRGSNFIMKLDERTLPSGYRLTTENPRVVRTTRGKMVKLNFGAAIHKVYRLDVDQRAYTDNGEQLRDPWTEQLRLLVLQLQERPAVLRLAYHVGPDEAEEDAHKRQARLSDWIQRLYAERPRQESEADQPQDKERKIPPLVIEMETVATKGAKQ
ncbi:MAG: beta strand repeat-containing protein [Zoogloea sp.]|uniref:beta strand repeat-containing protein n=1 Tax=Zoogloea sp. TaxID=49181 RepID=UPI003F327368